MDWFHALSSALSTLRRVSSIRNDSDCWFAIAARIYDPIVRGLGGDREWGRFLKDYRPTDW